MNGRIVTLKENLPSYALKKQNVEEIEYEFPFSLNPFDDGCFFGCIYCYVQDPPFHWGDGDWTKEVKVKTRLPEKLERELKRYRNLPQHLKRVQIGNACELYNPIVLRRVRQQLGRDLMAEILEIFKRHWEDGNRWMLHVLTKSHLIGKHLDILSGMRDQVQVEMTLVCLSEKRRRLFERYAPSVSRRLRVIRQLSDAGIFVRIMAMPLLCYKDEALKLKRITFNHGARAIKNKGLNYFDFEAMMKGVPVRTNRRTDQIDPELLVESGERVNNEIRTVLIPRWVKGGKWGDLQSKEMHVLRSGYAQLNDINWGYLI